MRTESDFRGFHFRFSRLIPALILTVLTFQAGVHAQPEAVPAEAPTVTSEQPVEPLEAAEASPEAVQPATPEPPEPEPLFKNFDPKKSYANLVRPDVAAKMALTDQQRSEVQRLLAVRARKLAVTPETEWEALVLENESQLAALLTPEQQKLWPSVFSEKKISFVFKYQAWEDVLTMFAEQAGLQLVMDVPPPGTFNYSDSREYTPSEAIDKINSVLQTKGYTLVRNDKMLMVFDLRKGRIPAQFLPKVKPAALGERGRFEFTTCVFPLGGRNRVAVLRAIEPFKGPYCHVVPLSGNSLMITDTASSLQVIDKIIMAIHEPQAPPAVAPPPPTPLWKTYVFTKIDAGEADALLKEFVPSLKSLRLGNSQQLHLLAPEAEHLQLKAIVDLLEQSDTTEQKRTTVAYSVEKLLQMPPQQLWQMARTRAQLLNPALQAFNPLDASLSVAKEIAQMVKLAVPGAVVSETPIAGKLIVFATPEGHEKVRAMIESLKESSDSTLPADEKPVVKLYRFTDENKVMDASVLKLIRAIVPDVQTTFDDENNRLLVVATAKEHQQIGEAVAELDAAIVPVEDRNLVVYRLSRPTIQQLHQVLQSLQKKELKGIIPLREAKSGQMTILATAKQHEAIRKLIGEITGTPYADGTTGKTKGTPERELAVFPMDKGSAATAYQLFLTTFPEVDLTIDYARNALVAYGAPDAIAVLRKAAGDLDRGVAQEIVLLPVKGDLPQQLLASLNRIAPKATFLFDRENKRLLVHGTATEIEKARQVVLQAETTGAPKGEVLVYTPKNMQGIGPVVTTLTAMYPDAKITQDTPNNRLIIRHEPADKETLLALLEKLDVDAAAALEVYVYTIKKLTPASLIGILQAQIPGMLLTQDPVHNRLIFRLKPGEKEKLLPLLEKVDAVDPDSKAVLLYSPKHVDTPTIMALLAEIYPGIRITNDAENNRLVIRLTAEDKEPVAALLKELDAEDPDRPKRLFRSFPIDAAPENARLFVRDLQKLVPRAKLTYDPASLQLVVWGTDEEQKVVAEALKNFKDGNGVTRSFLRLPLYRAEPNNVIIPIYRLFHRSAITIHYDTPSRMLIIQAHPNLHAKLREIKELIDPETIGPNDPEVRFYSLKSEPTSQWVNALKQLAPGATITPEKESKQLMVIAPPPLQAVVAANVKNIDESFIAPEEPVLYVYEVEEKDKKQIEAFVRIAKKDLPGLSLVPDETPKRISVWGKPSEHKLLATVIEQVRSGRENEPSRSLKVFTLRHGDAKTARETLKIAAPEATVIPDSEGDRLLVWAETEILEQVVDIVEQLETPDEKQRFTLGVYSFGDADPVMVESTLRNIVPDAESTSSDDLVNRLGYQHRMERAYGYNPRRIMRRGLQGQTAKSSGIFRVDPEQCKAFVFVAAADHKIVEDAMKSLRESFDKAEPKQAKRFVLQRAEPQSIAACIRRVYPSSMVTVEARTGNLIVEAYAKTMLEIDALVASLDPATPGADDLVARFYALDAEPTPMLLAAIRQIAPKAGVYPDQLAKQVLVIAKQHEQVRIAADIKSILTGYTVPEEPVLVVYAVPDAEKPRVTAFITTARRELRGLSVVPDRQPGRLSVWAKPTEHKMLADVLEQMRLHDAAEAPMELRSFPVASGSQATLRQILSAVHPETQIFIDTAGNRLLAWGTAAQLEKIAETLKVQESIDARQMLAYPVSASKPTTLREVIQSVYPGLKISVDDRLKRLLVWATPQEHAKIAEIVEQANKELSGEALAELEEKFVAYVVPGLEAASFSKLLKTMMPELKIDADLSSEKVTVLARTKEHEQIRKLVEQLSTRDAGSMPVLEVHPYGDADPVMLEGFLRSILPNAESMTHDSIVIQLGWQFYYQRYPHWYGRNQSSAKTSAKKIGYFKVDPKNQAVYAFVMSEDQKPIAEAVAKFKTLGEGEGAKPVLRRYMLEEMSYYDVSHILQQIAPSAVLESIYTPTKGSNSYRDNYKEFLAYAREGDQERIATTVQELNAGTGAEGTKTMSVITIPSDSPYDRVKILETIKSLFPEVNPTEGATANQIFIWAAGFKRERVQQMIDEACKPLPEGEQAVHKTYPLRYAKPADLAKWLKGIAPNATFEVSLVPGNSFREEKKSLVVLATPLEHLRIAKSVETLDKEMPADFKAVPRYYSLDDFPPNSYWGVFLAVYRTFEGVTLMPTTDQLNLAVIATEEKHQEIAAFLQDYLKQREQSRRYLEIYGLVEINYQNVSALLRQLVPTATINPGNRPNQVVVFGTSREHLEITDALKKLELKETFRPGGQAEDVAAGIKVYRVHSKQAAQTAAMLGRQFPAALVTPSGAEQIIVWGSPRDHAAIEKIVAAIAEAYPEPTLKAYFVKHIPVAEAHGALQQIYQNEAVVTLRRDTGDLMVQAIPAVQTRVAATIEQLDRPRPSEAEKMPRAYDLSDLQPGWIGYIAQTIWNMYPGISLLPGLDNRLIVWARDFEHKKIDALIEQMVSERPETSAVTETYIFKRTTAQAALPLIRQIAPNIRYTFGSNAAQLIVRTKPAEQERIRETVEKMNAEEPGLSLAVYSLKNMNYMTASRLVRDLLAARGVPSQNITLDYTGNQLLVETIPENHRLVSELLAKLKTEERDLEVFPLEKVDLETARMAVYALFLDESIDTAPGVELDAYTNTLFLRGTKEQIERTRRMLIKMGETQLLDDPTQAPGRSGKRGSKLRVINVEGDVGRAIGELEKLWPQVGKGSLYINRQAEPLIQKKEEKPEAPAEKGSEPAPGDKPGAGRSGGFYSVQDNPEKTPEKESENAEEPTPGAGSAAPPNVYLTVNDDGSITIASYDSRSLDQLEQLLERINSRVVFEGRDYTIFSVRNVSANDVYQKLILVLRERLQGAARSPQTRARYGTGYRTPQIPLQIMPEIQSNTIYVKGSKAERNEIEELIAMFDVSELPGERIVRKPIRVMVQNTQATRIVQQVYNVYQQKLMLTSLPGGVRPRLMPDTLTNSIDIIAPEPLATELKEYIEELDKKVVDEPARRIRVIPLEVKANVVQEAINVIQQSQGGYGMPYGGGYNPYGMSYGRGR